MNSIHIFKKQSTNLKKTNIIQSTKSNRISEIQNKLTTSFYEIYYESFKRPVYDKNEIYINKNLKSASLKIRDNILIIGASSGIGYELLKILENNSKIKIFATYKNNPINIKKKNIFPKKIDLEENLKKIHNIIKNFRPIRVYYFATPKIYFGKIFSKKIIRRYKNFYVNFPLEIIKKNYNFIRYFFYPSSEFINFNPSSTYSKYKIMGERKILQKKIKNKNIFSFRFPDIYSKQSISLRNPKPQTLSNLLMKNSILKNILL